MPTISNPAYFPVPLDGGNFTFSVIEVADAAARLGLTRDTAAGRMVRQLDDLTQWTLATNGVPSNPDHWFQLDADTLKTSPQTLTNARKAQAQKNITLSGSADPNTLNAKAALDVDLGGGIGVRLEAIGGGTFANGLAASVTSTDEGSFSKVLVGFGPTAIPPILTYSLGGDVLLSGIKAVFESASAALGIAVSYLDGCDGTEVVAAHDGSTLLSFEEDTLSGGTDVLPSNVGVAYHQIVSASESHIWDCGQFGVWTRRVEDADIPTTANDVGAVGYTPQTGWTDAEKRVARENINAAAANDYIDGTLIAVVGDSLMANATSSILYDQNPQVAMHWYSCGILRFVSPAGRSAIGIAVGGTDSKEARDGQSGVYQVTEALASGAEVVLFQLGANDVNGPSYTYSLDGFATYYNANVGDMLIAGKRVVAQLPIPGGSQTASGFGGPYNEALEAITARIESDLSGVRGVFLMDMRPDFEDSDHAGLWSDAATETFGWSDGIHPPRAARMHMGREMARLFSATHNSLADAWTMGVSVNENPYLKSTGTNQLAVVSNPYSGTITYAARADGTGTYGERFADITMTPTTQAIGSGNGLVTYTAIGSTKFFVQHYYSSTETVTTLSIRAIDAGGYKLIEVFPKHAGATMQSTAAEVAAAIAADPVVSQWVTAAAGGDGSAVVTGGAPAAMELRTPLDPATDADAPTATDYVRAIIELHKHPVDGWSSIGWLTMQLRRAVPSAGNIAFVDQSWITAPWPEPIGDRMIVDTPWILNTAENLRFSIRAFMLFWGTLRVARVTIQKRATAP